MQGGGRNFSTKIPKWAKFLHVVIIALFGGIFLGSLLLIGYGFYVKGVENIILGIIFGVSFGWLFKLSISNFALYQRWTFEVKLTDEGYFTHGIDERTKEEQTELVLFEQMESVLISRIQNFIPDLLDQPLPVRRFRVNALLFIIWKDDTGKKQIKHFTHSNMKDLDEWLELFDQHNIPIDVTHIDLRNIPIKERISALESVEKTSYSRNGTFSVIIPVGSITREEPIKLEEKYKKVHSFRIHPSIFLVLSSLFSVWLFFQIVREESFSFSVIDIPIHIHALIAGAFMYFSRKLSLIKVLQYLLFVIVILFMLFMIGSVVGVVEFAYDADLFGLCFMITMESFIVYAFVRILRSLLKADYHEEINIYHKNLKTSPFKRN